MTSGDPFDLDRFLVAQQTTYATALAELTAGRKQSHWMWFIFPQLRGLGSSPTANFYGIASIGEAHAYLRHAVLGARLVTCTEASLVHAGRSLRSIFGTPDDLKFRSSMTLFEAAANGEPPVFAAALAGLCDGVRDPQTLRLLSKKDQP